MNNLSSHSSFPYIITLSSLDENQLEEWFDHLDLVFEKTPREYFVNHWMNDPCRDIKGIQIAVATSTKDNSKTVASTVRTFLRKIFLNGQIVAFGGIGEVSTKPAFRNKGLAKVLLQKSVEFMQAKQIVISGLHTSSSAPLYASLGWLSKNRLFVHRTSESILAFQDPESYNTNFKIRPSDLSNSTELATVMTIQRTYSSHFNGPFVRDESYWKNWIIKEIGQGCHYILEDVSSAPSIVCFILLDTKTRKFPETLLLVRDFAVNEKIFGKDRGKSAFLALVQHALQNNSKYTHVRYPAPLFEEWEGTAEVEVQEDTGTMYRVIEPDYQVNQTALSDVMGSLDPHTHVFWDVDAF